MKKQKISLRDKMIQYAQEQSKFHYEFGSRALMMDSIAGNQPPTFRESQEYFANISIEDILPAYYEFVNKVDTMEIECSLELFSFYHKLKVWDGFFYRKLGVLICRELVRLLENEANFSTIYSKIHLFIGELCGENPFALLPNATRILNDFFAAFEKQEQKRASNRIERLKSRNQ